MAINTKQKEALRHIRNYVMHTSRMPSMRDLQKLMDYKSPRSAMVLLDQLAELGYLQKRDEGSYRLLRDLDDINTIQTVLVPFVGVVTCGLPILAEENIYAHIPVAVSLVTGRNRYFILKAQGDSMDLAGIEDGDFILVRQQPVAENGDSVVALIDDEATIKVFNRRGDIIALLPKSSNSRHQPIIVTSDLRVQGIVTAVIPSVNK